ncbi:hypothetical protein ACNR9Q_04530 [Maribacter sp. X9]|uniref:hypothetical protein n=1 Tax=Maribacter sp. X9 TaxID=3402159 RepID=UPI003AF371D5
MNFSRNLRFWNVILVITLILCISVLALHYKNWIKSDQQALKLTSGFYHVAIPFKDLDSVFFVERIPPMIRLNGFSALEKEKGLFREFKDSLTDKKVHVFVDNINHQKLKLVYNDSLYVYFNLKDSVKTTDLKNDILSKIQSHKVPN